MRFLLVSACTGEGSLCTYRFSQTDRKHGQQRTAEVGQAQELSQAALEPRQTGAGELAEAPVRGVGLLGGFFEGRGRLVRVAVAGLDPPVHRKGQDQNQSGDPLGVTQLGLFETEAAAFESENIGSIHQRTPSSRTAAALGTHCIATIQGSGCPGSCSTPILVSTPDSNRRAPITKRSLAPRSKSPVQVTSAHPTSNA
jgi:hypothetical protein